MKKKDVTKEKLVKVVEEMNTILELEPPIETEGKGITKAKLIDEIEETAEHCFKPGDVISPETQEVLKALEIPFPDQADEVDESQDEEAAEPPKTEKKEKVKKEKKEKVKKTNRLMATIDAVAVLGLDAEDDELAKKASEIYLKNGGKDVGDKETKQAMWWVKNFRQVTAAMKERGVTV